jgi:hypothetical protein
VIRSNPDVLPVVGFRQGVGGRVIDWSRCGQSQKLMAYSSGYEHKKDSEQDSLYMKVTSRWEAWIEQTSTVLVSPQFPLSGCYDLAPRSSATTVVSLPLSARQSLSLLRTQPENYLDLNQAGVLCHISQRCTIYCARKQQYMNFFSTTN